MTTKITIGDVMHLEVTCRRQWWQFWLPKEWKEWKTFRVGWIATGTVDPSRPAENTDTGAHPLH